MLVVTLGGSPSQRSRSGVLLEKTRQWLQDKGVEVVSYQIRDFPAEDLLHARFDSPKVIDLLQQVANADGLVIATPVYKASFSGALKTVLDLLPERALAHKIVLPMATGGSIAHMLAVDYALEAGAVGVEGPGIAPRHFCRRQPDRLRRRQRPGATGAGARTPFA